MARLKKDLEANLAASMNPANIDVGSLVWAKMTASAETAYLGIIVPSMPNPDLTTDGTNFLLVYWLSSKNISKLKRSLIFDIFDIKMTNKLKLDSRGVKYGVKIVDDWMENDYMQGQDFTPYTMTTYIGSIKEILREKQSFGTIPKDILRRIAVIQKKSAKIYLDSQTEDRQSTSIMYGATRSVENICLGCKCYCKKETSKKHPTIEGLWCQNCFERAQPITPPQDEYSTHCIVCGWFFKVKTCENCRRLFCYPCLEFWGQLIQGGSCVVCNPDFPQQEIAGPSMLACATAGPSRVAYSPPAASSRTHAQTETDTIPPVSLPVIKEGLRVLSLFDGISTGLVALQNQKIKVNAYFSSEIDEHAIIVSSHNHGDKITQLGDVTKLNRKIIQGILPIHLVMGGSPCSDLSKVNPARKGLTDSSGTGPLFFEFVRVVNLVNEEGNSNPRGNMKNFYFFYENVASMDLKERDTISRFLEVKPVIIDAQNFSAMSRKRLFWGNIPRMGLLAKSRLDTLQVGEKIKLQDFLLKNLRREATVIKTRTITTNKNSLTQSDGSSQILMEGKKSTLSVQEIEHLFGLPQHYTDVQDLTPAIRRKLIGKSWSVQVVSEIVSNITENSSVVDVIDVVKISNDEWDHPMEVGL